MAQLRYFFTCMRRLRILILKKIDCIACAWTLISGKTIWDSLRLFVKWQFHLVRIQSKQKMQTTLSKKNIRPVGFQMHQNVFFSRGFCYMKECYHALANPICRNHYLELSNEILYEVLCQVLETPLVKLLVFQICLTK